jgi:hypothetical protein
MSYTPPAGSNVTLIFANAYTSPAGNAVTLNFSPAEIYTITITIAGVLDDVTGIISLIPARTANIAATLDDTTGLVIVRTVVNAAISAALDDITGTITADWQAGVWRGLFAHKRGVYAGEIANKFIQYADGFSQATPKRPEINDPIQAANPMPAQINSGWVDVAHQHKAEILIWDIGTQLAQQRQADYKASPARRLGRSNVWDQADPLQTQRSSAYIAPGAKPKAWLYRYDEGLTKLGSWQSFYGIATDVYRRETLLWDQGTPHSWICGGWHHVPPLPLPNYIPSTELVFYQFEPDFIGGAILVFGRLCFAWPLKPKNPIISLTGATIVLHTINVKRVSDNVEIPVLSAALKFDSESWAWGVMLNLKTPETMALLESVNGEPREILIELDDIYFTVLIEEWGESRLFGEHTYTASGRSSLALFAYPYAPLRSYLETTDKTAAQLIDYELLNTGWSAAYHTSLVQLFTTDWLVPGGAWSYQNKAPIDCIVQIARAAGARAYADRNGKLVHIAPRYPFTPWNWIDATPDQTIPLSLVRSISTQLSPQPDYNHVIVSGQSHGVTVSANITGSGGDVSAPMITDNLITYVDAGLERARNVLSNTGRQARVTIDLPLNDTTGLLEPGQLVEVSDTIPWRGLVTGINISAAHGSISQSVEIERHYP